MYENFLFFSFVIKYKKKKYLCNEMQDFLRFTIFYVINRTNFELEKRAVIIFLIKKYF